MYLCASLLIDFESKHLSNFYSICNAHAYTHTHSQIEYSFFSEDILTLFES